MIEYIDWGKVEAAIGAEEDFLNFDYAAIKDAVLQATDAYAEDDLKNLILGVEEEVEIPWEGWQSGSSYEIGSGGEIPVPEQTRRAKGIVDLRLLTPEGKLKVVDWKTTQAVTMPDAEKYSKSWQWRMYAAAAAQQVPIENVIIEYRVITRAPQIGTITLLPSARTVERVELQLRSIAAEYDALAEFPVWPQNMPGACKAYGRVCPYEVDCLQGTMPLRKMPFKDLSFSGMEKFMLCHERVRREAIEEERDSGVEAGFGSAFHRGMAEVYTQLKERQNGVK